MSGSLFKSAKWLIKKIPRWLRTFRSRSGVPYYNFDETRNGHKVQPKCFPANYQSSCFFFRMLPNIANKSAVPIERFLIKLDGIEDLFYDSKINIDHTAEVKRIQVVLNKNIEKLDANYCREGDNSMDRAGFERFVERSIGVSGPTAGEIFSCCTGLYGSSDNERDVGEDALMTRSEFATGVVRLANLYALINEGMVNTSELAHQTAMFLSSI